MGTVTETHMQKIEMLHGKDHRQIKTVYRPPGEMSLHLSLNDAIDLPMTPHPDGVTIGRRIYHLVNVQPTTAAKQLSVTLAAVIQSTTVRRDMAVIKIGREQDEMILVHIPDLECRVQSNRLPPVAPISREADIGRPNEAGIMGAQN